MSLDNRQALIGFSVFPGIGPVRFALLKKYFGSAVSAWQSSAFDLEKTGLGSGLVKNMVDFRQVFEYESFLKDLAAREIRVITQADEDYPGCLLEIPDPPLALYIRGNLPADWTKAIAVVGTRKPTGYGREVTENLTADLVRSGCLIVSGMARGVDGIAHRTALKYQCKTVAVLGCGVDIIYPPEHRDLYADIIKNGAVLSEVPPGHIVNRGLFPARNRIISGLSRCVVVTEGAKDSGSLITARMAAEQGRDVFAVPGPITSYLSAGPAGLIQAGAKLVVQVEDILQELQLPSAVSIPLSPENLTEVEKKILAAVAGGEAGFDEIVRVSHLAAAEVGSQLSLLEIKGLVKNLGDGKYCLRK